MGSDEDIAGREPPDIALVDTATGEAGAGGVVGREQDIRELAESRSKVTLLVGDAGVGKSTVLLHAQLETTHAIAPAPVRVQTRPGALQGALLEALGRAVADLAVEQSAARRVGEALMVSISKLAASGFDALTKAVGRALLRFSARSTRRRGC